MMDAVARSLAVAVGLLALLPAVCGAQMYRWEEDGAVHFSNAPDLVPESNRSSSASPSDPAVPDAVPDPEIRNEPPAPPSSLTRIPFAPGAPIIVSARISDAAIPVSLILDTGADRTVIAPQALQRIGISTQNGSQTLIRGVTGSGHADVVQVASVQVGDAKVGPLRIVAHDADLRQAEGLLGRDFLEHFTVTIDAREQVVTLAPK